MAETVAEMVETTRLDIDTPYSDGWWLARLVGKLNARRKRLDMLDEMYRGEHPLPFASEDEAEGFDAFQRLSRSNYLVLVVEAVLDRLRVVGFRAGADDQTGDTDSWGLWQRARLDANQSEIYRTALILGRAYALVTPHPRRTGEVLVTPEDPREVVVETYPEDRHEVRAALKVFYDDVYGVTRAYLFLADRVVKFVSPAASLVSPKDPSYWTADALRRWRSTETAANPTAPEIPVVEFMNRPGLQGQTSSEFEDVIEIQNRINNSLFVRLVAEKFGAFRQTALLNYEFQKDSEGNPIMPDLTKDPALAWLLSGDKVGVWESQQTSTADILRAVEADIRDLASTTRTPPHYLLNSIVNSSAEALKSAETGLVAKVRDRMGEFGEAWEQVLHLAHILNGTPREAADLEVIWQNPESKSEAELADAVQKRAAVGVTWRQSMEDLGYTQPQIARMEADRLAEQLTASILAPPQPTAIGAGVEETDDVEDAEVDEDEEA